MSVYYWAKKLGMRLDNSKRGPVPAADWDTVDLSLPRPVLARKYGVSESCISNLRQKRKKAGLSYGGTD
jgi:hypothetical protein